MEPLPIFFWPREQEEDSGESLPSEDWQDSIQTKAVGTREGFLDSNPLTMLRANWETAAWAVILVVAIVSRFYELGARGMSHDESLHAVYSLDLYRNGSYQHNPMMHGPFLFHANAFIYFLFGVSDATARVNAGSGGHWDDRGYLVFPPVDRANGRAPDGSALSLQSPVFSFTAATFGTTSTSSFSR